MHYIALSDTTSEAWGMARETVTFRIDQGKRAELDRLAKALDRDRSYVLNEAVDAYLDVHAWQAAHIEDGLRQAEAGEFADDAEVAAAYERLLR